MTAHPDDATAAVLAAINARTHLHRLHRHTFTPDPPPPTPSWTPTPTPPAFRIPTDLAPPADTCDACHGTHTVPCWSPGGPCPPGQAVCELCGPCSRCTPTFRTPNGWSDSNR